MKKAFTLSEALITMAVIGILAAVLIPVMSKAKPDKDKIVYKKAIYAVQAGMQHANNHLLNDTGISLEPGKMWDDSHVPDDYFCEQMADAMNTAGAINCNPSGSGSTYASPNFETTDGIRIWGLEGKITGGPEEESTSKENSSYGYKTIRVDRVMDETEVKKYMAYRNAQDSSFPAPPATEATNSNPGLKLRLRSDGKVTTLPSWEYENKLINTSFQVQRDSN
ncbi:type II secretion system protein [bacterium]|nr:type II secretion system protein [bacterium]